MDKLKLAFKLVARAANEKREAGKVPAFLGARGLLALMYDRIVAFSEHDTDHSEYLLELAVMGVFAFATALPDMEIDDLETTTEEEDDFKRISAADPSVFQGGPGNETATSADAARWTPVAPGEPLPIAPPMTNRLEGLEEGLESDD